MCVCIYIYIHTCLVYVVQPCLGSTADLHQSTSLDTSLGSIPDLCRPALDLYRPWIICRSASIYILGYQPWIPDLCRPALDLYWCLRKSTPFTPSFPFYPAVTTALHPLIWCFESQSAQESSSLEEYFFPKHRYQSCTGTVSFHNFMFVFAA